MDSQFIALVTATIGLALGVLITWLLTRGRTTAAIEQGKAEVAVDLAMANERVRSIEAERGKLSEAHEVLQSQANGWRNELNQARDDLSKLNERASRIPVLDEKLAGLEAALAEASQQAAVLREASGRINAELKAGLQNQASCFMAPLLSNASSHHSQVGR